MHRVHVALEPLARPHASVCVDDDGPDALERFDERQAALGPEDEHGVVELVREQARSVAQIVTLREAVAG